MYSIAIETSMYSLNTHGKMEIFSENLFVLGSMHVNLTQDYCIVERMFAFGILLRFSELTHTSI